MGRCSLGFPEDSFAKGSPLTACEAGPVVQLVLLRVSLPLPRLSRVTRGKREPDADLSGPKPTPRKGKRLACTQQPVWAVRTSEDFVNQPLGLAQAIVGSGDSPLKTGFTQLLRTRYKVTSFGGQSFANAHKAMCTTQQMSPKPRVISRVNLTSLLRYPVASCDADCWEDIKGCSYERMPGDC